MPETLHIPFLLAMGGLLAASLLTLGIVIRFYLKLRHYLKQKTALALEIDGLRDKIRALTALNDGMAELGSMRCFVANADSLEVLYHCGNNSGRFSKIHSLEIFAAGLHEDDRHHFLDNCRKLLDGTISEFHEEYRCKVGKGYRRIKEIAQILPSSRPGEKYLLLADMDVSELEERTLRWGSAEQLLSGIFADMPGYIFLKNCTDNFSYIRSNSTFAGLFGMSPQELCGKNDDDLFDKDMALRIRASNLEALRSENVVSHKWYFTAANERQIAMICVQRYLHCDGGNDYILGMGMDISGMEHVERTIRRRNQLLRLLVNALPCDLMLLDKELYILTGNNAMVEAFGVPLEEMRQHRGTELDSGFGNQDPIKLAARDGQAHTGANDCYQVTALPLTDENGNVTNYVVWRTLADAAVEGSAVQEGTQC